MRNCWCGNDDLLSFSSEYYRCNVCGTLVSSNQISDVQLSVSSDEAGFYNKNYWLDHQHQLGLPDIYTRARNDLTERNLYWIKTLLSYRLPPANVLELGCSHGGFVALMRQAGYEASGLEMSPWVVSFARETFDIPIYLGQVESLDLPDGSCDVIVLMDVLEHLSDPVMTMRHCIKLLKNDGFLLIQTPNFQEHKSYEEMLSSKDAFLDMLISDEHLYLFSQNSVRRLFQQIGAEHIYFEQAIFSDYDMFLVVGCSPLEKRTTQEVESALLQTSGGRVVLSLLDLRERELNLMRQLNTLASKFHQADLDRKARLEQVHQLTQWLEEARQALE